MVMMVGVLTACTTSRDEFRVNGSSAVTTERSIEAIKRKLKQDDRLPFDAAIKTIQFSALRQNVDMTDKQKLIATDLELVGKKIHGLTYTEIMALAEQSPYKVTIERHSRIFY